MPWSLAYPPSLPAAQSPSRFSAREGGTSGKLCDLSMWIIFMKIQLRTYAYLYNMCQTCALIVVQWMIQTFRQPIAQHINLGCVPLLKNIENPQFIIHLPTNLVHVVSREIHVALPEIFARTRNIREAQNTANQTAFIIPRKLWQRRFQYRHQFADNPLIHSCQCLINLIINLRVILMLKNVLFTRKREKYQHYW